MPCLFIFFCVLVLAMSSSAFFSSISDTLRGGGASLSVEKQDDILVSSNGIFSAGFHPIGQNALCFAIWFNFHPYNYQIQNRTIVWMANRDKPVNRKHSKLSLQKDGNLILNSGRFNIWATNTFSISSAFLHLKESGNLVLKNSEDAVLWQSFDSPTDTLLPLQLFTKSTKLISSRSQSNFSSGFYKLYFNYENIISMVFDNTQISSVYWPPQLLQSWEDGRSVNNISRIAMLDPLGNFSSSDDLTFLSVDYGSNIQRRLKIDSDGNLRLYSRKNQGGGWYVSWQAFSDPCLIDGICGANAVCSNDPSSGRKCSCLPGHKMKNPTDWTNGCKPKFSLSCSKYESKFLKLVNVEFFGNDFGFFNNYTLSQCKELCLSQCKCKGFLYLYMDSDTFECHPKMSLLNGYRRRNYSRDLYLRLPKTHLLPYEKSLEESRLNCSYQEIQKLDKHVNESVKLLLWIVYGVGGFEIMCFLLVWYLLTRNQRNLVHQDNRDYPFVATGFRRFSFVELKKATQGFNKEIGRGSGGIVYKGVLSDALVAAIKRLHDEANQAEAEFLAEVDTIGRLNHMNLIEMWGYCAEGKHRLLVYKYMEHGSLKQNLSNPNVLDWKKRFEIAVGTAKGLAYLHEQCLEWVLHCDVKPQNILLDSNYKPKVADFGLSKLLKRGELNNSRFSRIRGTRGYMAPEWVFSQPITSKVDVFSYGIVVLEMLTGKSPKTAVQDVNNTGETEHRRLVGWVRENIKGNSCQFASLLKKIMDPSMKEGEYDMKKMEMLFEVALKCIEEEKNARPTMSQVVKMLQDH